MSAITSVNTSNKNVVTNGLIGHWTFDGKDTNWSSTTAEVYDRSGYNNHLDATSSVSSRMSYMGKIGQSLRFDSNKFNMPALLSLSSSYSFGSTTNFSVSFWFLNKSINNTSSYLIDNDGYNSSLGRNSGFGCIYQGNSGLRKIYCTFFGSSSATVTTPNVTFTNENKWYHVVLVVNRSTGYAQMYVDGSASGNPVDISSVGDISQNFLFIGSGESAGNGDWNVASSNGDFSLDDVRIYNRALSLKEIQTLYKAGGGVTQSSVSNTKTNTNSVGISSGLVGHWTFDGKDTTWTSSTTGTTRDLSGNGRNGTLTNLNRNTSLTVGKVGQSFFLDGTKQIVLTSSPLENTDKTVTISGWIKSSTTSGERVIFAPNADFSWHVEQSGTQLAWRKGTDGILSSFHSQSNIITMNKWQFVTFVGTPSSLLIYSNGNLVTSTSTMGISTTTVSNPTIGGTASRYFQGVLDDIRVYNRALSAKEIQTLYKLGQTSANVTQTTNSIGLVGHWTFDGKDINWNASTTYNRGSNANNGTFVGLSATTSPRLGKIGQGLFFRRLATTTVSVGSNPPLTDDFSISFWTYPTVSENAVAFVSNYNGYSGNRVIITDNSFNLRFYAGTSTQTIGAPKLTPNKWYHIVAIRNSSTGVLSMYNNGTLVGTSASGLSQGSLSYVSNGTLAIGSEVSIGPAAGCACVMDDVRVYNRVISDSEIKALYKMGSQ